MEYLLQLSKFELVGHMNTPECHDMNNGDRYEGQGVFCAFAPDEESRAAR